MSRIAIMVVLTPTILAGQAPDLAAVADRTFAQWTRETPGCAVGVAHQGRRLLARGYGMANLETGTPVTAETVFESGSVAKQFTATAVLLLMHDGKLRLDDPVTKFVPELPEYGPPITIRHLLSHTSGLREWSNLVAVDGWPRGTRVHTQNELLDAVFAQKELNYPVGDYYSYTNSGYGLLMTIVERVSGMAFSRFTEERIFKPLGMSNTGWRDDFARLVPGRAQAYSRRGSGWALEMPFENVIGPGGMLTTVGDWLTWNDALDRKTLGGWLVDSLESRATLTSGKQISYAMGVTVSNWRGEREVAHSGSTGGYSTYLMRIPARGVSVAVLCNAANANATGFARQMAEALVPDLAAAPMLDTVALDPAAAGRLSGVYRSTRSREPLFVGVSAPGGGRGVPVRALRDGGLLVANGRVLESGGRGGPPAALRLAQGQDTVEFLRVGAAAWSPAVSELSAFIGRYTSPEIRATWAATVENGRLVLSVRRGRSLLLTPVYQDAFAAGGLGTVWFSRDGAGRVTAMHISSARMWNLTLPRLD